MVNYPLFTSKSQDAVKLIDTLQSALYDSANAPSSADAIDAARYMASNAGSLLTNSQLAAGQQAQIEIWKLNNQRFSAALIGASQYHSPAGDQREISIGIGGRRFEIRLMSLPGLPAAIQFSEWKQ